jgi:ribosome-associated protein
MAGLPAEAVVQVAGQAAREKKGVDLVALDLTTVSGIADYFVVVSARSTTHADTIAEAVRRALRERGARLRHVEGTADSGWLLMDYGDVIVHVFLEDTRRFYDLERLWGDAPLVTVEG